MEPGVKGPTNFRKNFVKVEFSQKNHYILFTHCSKINYIAAIILSKKGSCGLGKPYFWDPPCGLNDKLCTAYERVPTYFVVGKEGTEHGGNIKMNTDETAVIYLQFLLCLLCL